MYRLLDSLGFGTNPFGSYVAEKEPNLDEYIVRPAYFKTIMERTTRAESFILFGARGAGKSATRIALYKECWNRIQQRKTAPLAITLDSFSGLLAKGLNGVTLATFVDELAFLVVEAILVWLAALNDDDRSVFTEALDQREEQLAISLVQGFYLSRPELARKVASTKALQLLDQAWHERSMLWVQKKWDGLANIVASIANALIRRTAHTEHSIEGSLAAVLRKTKAAEPDQIRFSFETVTQLVLFARMLGFSGIVVLIDKADETQYTNDSAEATAKLLYPILSDTRLLETDGMSWIFFLWNKVREHYGSGKMPVRLDKVANAEIAWDKQFLIELVDRRLAYFSGGRVRDISFLLAPGANSEILVEVVNLSMNSPRELIRILDTILRENDERNDSPGFLLTSDSIARGLDRYAQESVENSLDKTTLQQFAKLAQTQFTNPEVQAAFRIKDASARNRIRIWVDAGLVTQTGTRPSGEAGGKPVHEYGIVDERLRRIVARKLASPTTIDAADNPSE